MLTYRVKVIRRYKFLQIDDYSLVKFLPLDQTDEDSVNDILLQIDTCLQYGEDQEPRELRVDI